MLSPNLIKRIFFVFVEAKLEGKGYLLMGWGVRESRASKVVT